MSIPAEHLREGQVLYLKGRVSYARIAAQINGAELERRVAQAKARGQLYPTSKPHTTISVIDPVVIPADPNNPTIEERYLEEKIFTLKSGDNAGKRAFSVDNTTRTLPQVFAPNANGVHEQVQLTGDLDTDLDVVLVIRVFKSSYEKRGLSLDKVIVNEPLRYYQSADSIDTAMLARLGITIEGPVTRVNAVDAPESAIVQRDEPEEVSLPQPQAEAAPVPQAPTVSQADDEVARLERQIAEAKAKQVAKQAAKQAPAPAAAGQSAFDAEPASPWEAGNPGIGFGG